jgi:drug/metabolite transporter (DMT)-like permease
MKGAVTGVSPFLFNALRLSLSALALGIAEHIEARGRPGGPVPWRAVVGLALLTSLVYQTLFITGIARTSASHTGFLIASGPLWTALIARLAGVERLERRAWAGLAIAFVGTGLVASAANGDSAASIAGNVLVLLAMVAWAWGTVLSRPVLERFPATRLAFLTTLVSLPYHWLLAWREAAPVDLDAAEWAAVAYAGVFSTGVAYFLWNWSVRHLGPSRTSAYTNLVPVCALVVAWAFLGERPGAVQLLGGGLTLLGLSLWRSRALGGATGRAVSDRLASGPAGARPR